MHTEDGPWTVIVAESPHESSSYILNVQSTSLITKRIGESLILLASSWGLVFFICTIGFSLYIRFISNLLIPLVSSPERLFSMND